MYSDRHTGSTGLDTERLVKKLSKNPDVNREESKPVYFFGEEDEYGLKTRLSFVDIAFLRNATEKVEVLCEIEESSVPPKKIIGDVVTPIFSKMIKVEEDSGRKFLDYDDKNRYLLVGLKYKTGVTCERAKILETKIKERGILREWKLKIISKKNMNELILTIEDEIKRRLNLT